MHSETIHFCLKQNENLAVDRELVRSMASLARQAKRDAESDIALIRRQAEEKFNNE